MSVPFEPPRDGGAVRVWLAPDEDDGEQPVRRLYWLLPAAVDAGWTTSLPEQAVDGWLSVAIASEFEHHPGADKRMWRQSTRYLPVRLRRDPPGLGVDAALVAALDLRWERV